MKNTEYNQPTLSIITVCYNSEKTIEDTLRSVASQSYAKIEHVIVDGGSTDNTLEIVKQFPHVAKVISEPDNGVYDAMNKGLMLAEGDVIGLLNADDFYANDTVLNKVAAVFEDSKIQACFADLVYVDQNDTSRVIRYWKSKPYEYQLFKYGWMPAHPTFFVRKDIYKQYGLFDVTYKIAADFELMFRLIEQRQITTRYIDKVLIKMRTGGTSNKSLKNITTQNIEIIRKLKSVYPDFSLSCFVLQKLLNRTRQFIQKPRVF